MGPEVQSGLTDAQARLAARAAARAAELEAQRLDNEERAERAADELKLRMIVASHTKRKSRRALALAVNIQLVLSRYRYSSFNILAVQI